MKIVVFIVAIKDQTMISTDTQLMKLASVITTFDGSSLLLIKDLVRSEHKYYCMMLAQKCSLNDMVLPDLTRQTNLTTSLYDFNKMS